MDLLTFNQRVAGSNPAAPTNVFNDLGGVSEAPKISGYTFGGCILRDISIKFHIDRDNLYDTYEQAIHPMTLKFYRSYKTIRRFLTRSSALYEPLQGNRNVFRCYKRNPHDRHISEYQVSEPAPTDAYFKNILTHLLSLAA
ncbi:MAG: hypothetical protein H0X26_04860 [Alphaproteobacteria bacterium]|nr:hypothetical protein [Alphaproteobacteria bacterium]